MAKRSDFAQKLLDDLRLRKERMAASQNTKGSNAMVADAYAYSKSTLLEKPEYGESMLHGENSSANKLRLGNQQKLQNNHGFQQVHMLQKSEPQEKKRQPEEREQQKQKLQEKKQKRPESVSSNISKPMSGATDLQKKQLQLNQAATSRKGSTEHTDATQLNGLVNGRHQENPAGERSSRNLNFKIKDSLSRNSSQHSTRGDVESESAKARIPFAVDEKPAISREADHEASRFEEAETQIIRPNVSVASPKSSRVAQEQILI